MPDAHVGYGLPIGGVLACENAVIPYAVGVDIACRMKLSVLDQPVESLTSDFNRYKEALNGGTRVRRGRRASAGPIARGDGPRLERHPHHARAEGHGLEAARHERLGQSLCRVRRADACRRTTSSLGLTAGEYVALLSHSGSRGAGAAVCSTYSQIAQAALPRAVQGSRPAGVARSRQRSGPGILGGDESDGRVRRGEPCGDPSAGGEAARGGDHRRRREPPQLRLEGTAPGPRAGRASQGRDAGRARACWA